MTFPRIVVQHDVAFEPIKNSQINPQINCQMSQINKNQLTVLNCETGLFLKNLIGCLFDLFY